MVEFVFDGVPMACISDPVHNRMRIIAPVIDEAKMTDPQRRIVLEANFHATLDARYATSQGGALRGVHPSPVIA